jgi:hypothetical protein
MVARLGRGAYLAVHAAASYPTPVAALKRWDTLPTIGIAAASIVAFWITEVERDKQSTV